MSENDGSGAATITSSAFATDANGVTPPIGDTFTNTLVGPDSLT
jgi:hypothetical protein